MTVSTRDDAIMQVLALFADRNYSALESLTGRKRLSAQEMAYAIEEYGRDIIKPPVAALEDLDVVEVVGAPVPTWSIVLPFWTAEEGHSDLTLELTLCERENGVSVEIDNIRVR